MALFSFIGAEPNSAWLDDVAVDEHGFVLTDRALEPSARREWDAAGRPLPFETSRPGLFAVGDLRSGSTKRVAAAVGEGSAAIRSVHDHPRVRSGSPRKAEDRSQPVGPKRSTRMRSTGDAGSTSSSLAASAKPAEPQT